MVENFGRFGFSEVMTVLRDAVRQTREPASSLSSADVSRYIQQRYDKTRSKSTVKDLSQPQTETPIDNESPTRESGTPSPRTRSLPRQLYKSNRKENLTERNEITRHTNQAVNVKRHPLMKKLEKIQEPKSKLASLGLSRSLESDLWYSNPQPVRSQTQAVIRTQTQPQDKKKTYSEDFKIQESRVKEENTISSASFIDTKKTEVKRANFRKFFDPEENILQKKPKTKLASLGLKKSAQLNYSPPPVKPEPKKVNKTQKKVNVAASFGPLTVQNAFEGSSNLYLRKREMLALAEEDKKLRHQRKHIDVLKELAEKTLNRAREEQKRIQKEIMQASFY